MHQQHFEQLQLEHLGKLKTTRTGTLCSIPIRALCKFTDDLGFTHSPLSQLSLHIRQIEEHFGPKD